jgi:RNA recognition motif-containing protein
MDLHIFNLSSNIIEADIRKMFSVFGEVTAAIIKRDKTNDRSTGLAFVNMSNDNLARQAIMNLDQTVIDGKRITISEIRQNIGKCFN